eukprot:2446679-Lingulodinium_polyedra.AAC.1
MQHVCTLRSRAFGPGGRKRHPADAPRPRHPRAANRSLRRGRRAAPPEAQACAPTGLCGWAEIVGPGDPQVVLVA